jgi:hypothetical protein
LGDAPLFLENVFKIALMLAKTGLKILGDSLFKNSGFATPKYVLFGLEAFVFVVFPF